MLPMLMTDTCFPAAVASTVATAVATTRRQTAHEVPLHYRCSGSDHGLPPVVLLAGLGAGGSEWADYLPELERQRVVLVPNYRAAAAGAALAPYATADLAHDLAAMLDHAGIGRVHIAGYSFGSLVAQEFALAYPERACSLTLISSYASTDPCTQQAIADGLALPQGNLAALQAALETVCRSSDGRPPIDMRRVQALLLSRTYSSAFLAHQAQQLRAQLASGGAVPNQAAAFAAQVYAALGHHSLPRLNQLRLPCLILNGEHDELVPAHCARHLAQAILHAQHVPIAAAGHGLLAEFAPTVSAHLLPWLTQHDGVPEHDLPT